MPLVEQELLTLPEHLRSPPVFSEVRVTRFLVLCVCFVDRCLSFCTFFLAIALSVLLRYTDSDYRSGIFKLFLCILKEQLFAWNIFFIDIFEFLFVFHLMSKVYKMVEKK